MKNVLILFISFCCLIACDEKGKIEKEISKLEVKIKIERFDRLFASAQPQDLTSLKAVYPFMFSAKYPDSLWIAKMKDTLQQQLSSEVEQQFDDFQSIEDELIQFYQHLKYYFPATNVPRIITVTSDVDYRNKVIVTDTIVLISLDTYLGENHPFYAGIQKYLKQNFNKEQIIADLAEKYASKQVFQSNSKSLLDEMIYQGKLLYIKDKIIPFKTDEEKIGYTREQLEWADVNESEIWRYFVENELLYSTDSQLPERFINPAPFSKFYLELDAESPGRLGRYIGWQIVRAYMNNNMVSLNNLLIADTETIFKDSKYKPRK